MKTYTPSEYNVYLIERFFKWIRVGFENVSDMSVVYHSAYEYHHFIVSRKYRAFDTNHFLKLQSHFRQITQEQIDNLYIKYPETNAFAEISDAMKFMEL